jgi:hypothetical protein
MAWVVASLTQFWLHLYSLLLGTALPLVSETPSGTFFTKILSVTYPFFQGSQCPTRYMVLLSGVSRGVVSSSCFMAALYHGCWQLGLLSLTRHAPALGSHVLPLPSILWEGSLMENGN